MKSNSNSDAVTLNGHSSAQMPGYTAPAVPISIYRELSAELQATKAMLDSVHAKNQQLTQQNQHLRQQIQQFVQSAISLEQLIRQPSGEAAAAEPTLEQHREHPKPDPSPSLGNRFKAAHAQLRSLGTGRETSEALFTEIGSAPYPVSDAERNKEASSIWLTMIICAVIVAAFGAGFLVVRPLLNNR
jgi:hypothetical protein